MELSARNQFPGTIRTVRLGNVMAEVVIDIGGGHEIVSVITRSSAERLTLREGDRITAVIKSTEVLVMK
jgi:molybdopterin-binding protein